MSQNATTSPLLRLPAEIRDKIWTEVLGGRLIHLDYHYMDDTMDFDDYDSFYMTHHGYSPWKHIVCEDDGPEGRGKEVVVANPRYFETLPGAKKRWGYPHHNCSLDYDPPGFPEPIEYDDHEGMRLTILRVSRQTYAEANNILWTTNTFSFPDDATCRRFMMITSINHRRLIRNLRFEMEWYVGMMDEWNKVLNIALIKSLIGLRSLRLNILYEPKQQHWNRTPDTFLETTTWTDGLRRLSTLPLTSAQVAFHIREWRLEMPDASSYWQESDRKACAKKLERILVNPQGADIYAEHRRQLEINRAINKSMEEAIRRDRRPF
ncbi:MAG: hypothetical protein Q9174_004232 [Haloplaca sp. 1 TL-2023]